MKDDEKKLILDLADQLTSMPSHQKDIEADDLIQQTIAKDQEAVYKLTQLVLVQHLAINTLKMKLAAVSQTGQSSSPKSFLDNLKEKFRESFSPQPSSQVNSNNKSYIPTPSPSAISPSAHTSSDFLGQVMRIGAGVAGGMMVSNALASVFSPHTNATNLIDPVNNNNDFINNFNDPAIPDPTTEDLSLNNLDPNDYSTDDYSSDDNSSSDW